MGPSVQPLPYGLINVSIVAVNLDDYTRHVLSLSLSRHQVVGRRIMRADSPKALRSPMAIARELPGNDVWVRRNVNQVCVHCLTSLSCGCATPSPKVALAGDSERSSGSIIEMDLGARPKLWSLRGCQAPWVGTDDSSLPSDCQVTIAWEPAPTPIVWTFRNSRCGTRAVPAGDESGRMPGFGVVPLWPCGRSREGPGSLKGLSSGASISCRAGRRSHAPSSA